MKTLTTYRNANVPGTRSILFLATIGLLLLAWGCQTTDTHQKKGDAPNVNIAIVYGRIDSIAPDKVNNKDILVTTHLYPCPNDPNSSGFILRQFDFAHINPSGTYRLIVHSQPWTTGKPPCFKLSLVSYDSKTSNFADYDSVLAAPKILRPGSDINFTSNFMAQAFDSVRVDFTVNDSTKRAVQDSAK